MSAREPFDPVQQAISAGIAGGIIVGLLQLSPLYAAMVEPICLALGVDPTKLTVNVVLAIERANANTMAQGYHVQWDPNNPAAPPHFVDKEGNHVS
jgi:hypothetical protein